MIDSKITASDLRIGNWVSVNGKYEEVVNIDEEGINSEIESGWYGSCTNNYYAVFEDTMQSQWLSSNASIVKPIPLTPDILEKCGFMKDGRQWRHPNDSAGVFVDEVGNHKRYKPLTIDKFTSGYYVETYYGGIEIKFLHQLQNLYYSLTNTNLIINNI